MILRDHGEIQSSGHFEDKDIWLLFLKVDYLFSFNDEPLVNLFQ